MSNTTPAASAVQEAAHLAWQQFTTGRDVDGAAIAPHILNGWQLSRKFGVDPIGQQVPPVLSESELADLYEENKPLLQAAEPMLKMLEVSIRDTGYIATLAVASGHLLAVVGNGELLDQAYSKYNIPGAVRSIKTVGVSALSLSITERRPIQVTGYEHYSRSFHDWRCSAAPIFDVDNEPIASLTLSSHISRPDIHTLTLAQSCAGGISIRLRERALMESQRHLNAMLESVHNALPESVIAINPEGIITHANNKAMSICANVEEELVGSSIDKIFSKPDLPRVRRIMAKCFPETLELEVLSRKGPANHMCRFVPIRLDNGDPCGMTLSISSKNQLIDIAKHVGGNYAKYSFEDIKGESPKLKAQIEFAHKAAVAGYRVLLYGESGTGKELFAQSIHNSGCSSKGPFVAISCAAIPRDLIESELFGYVGGAFTGARRNGMIGKMELATGGTLFLDEINSLPLEMQAKLLRVLQQMEIVRIGDTKPTPIDVRIIAATNRDLREAVRQGLFREDLYFRLNVVEITIPPLRERNEDISLLVHTFLRRQSYETNIPFMHISPEAMDALYSYSWPGNVRELDNACERALLMAGGGVIDIEHLPPYIAFPTGTAAMPGHFPGQFPGQLPGQFPGHLATSPGYAYNTPGTSSWPNNYPAPANSPGHVHGQVHGQAHGQAHSQAHTQAHDNLSGQAPGNVPTNALGSVYAPAFPESQTGRSLSSERIYPAERAYPVGAEQMRPPYGETPGVIGGISNGIPGGITGGVAAGVSGPAVQFARAGQGVAPPNYPGGHINRTEHISRTGQVTRSNWPAPPVSTSPDILAGSYPNSWEQAAQHPAHKQSAFGQTGNSVNDTYRNLVEAALESCQGNISKAAEHLGIARTTLYRKIKKFGISV